MLDGHDYRTMWETRGRMISLFRVKRDKLKDHDLSKSSRVERGCNRYWSRYDGGGCGNLRILLRKERITQNWEIELLTISIEMRLIHYEMSSGKGYQTSTPTIYF